MPPLLAALAYLVLGGVVVCTVALVGYALVVGVSDLLHDLEEHRAARRAAGRDERDGVDHEQVLRLANPAVGPQVSPEALAAELRRVRRAL